VKLSWVKARGFLSPKDASLEGCKGLKEEMMRKIIFFFFLISLISCSLLAINIDIPQELKNLGYTNEDLVDYKKEQEKEYYTLGNWQTKESKNTVTFVVVNGNIVDWSSP
jgi:hypothetical protein